MKESVNIRGIVSAFDCLATRERSGLKIVGSVSRQQIAHFAVLGRRELVSRGKAHSMLIAVEKAAAHVN